MAQNVHTTVLSSKYIYFTIEYNILLKKSCISGNAINTFFWFSSHFRKLNNPKIHNIIHI